MLKLLKIVGSSILLAGLVFALVTTLSQRILFCIGAALILSEYDSDFSTLRHFRAVFLNALFMRKEDAEHKKVTYQCSQHQSTERQQWNDHAQELGGWDDASHAPVQTTVYKPLFTPDGRRIYRDFISCETPLPFHRRYH